MGRIEEGRGENQEEPVQLKPIVEIDLDTFPGVGHHLDVSSTLGETFIHITYPPGATPAQIVKSIDGIIRLVERKMDWTDDEKARIMSNLTGLRQNFVDQIEGPDR